MIMLHPPCYAIRSTTTAKGILDQVYKPSVLFSTTDRLWLGYLIDYSMECCV